MVIRCSLRACSGRWRWRWPAMVPVIALAVALVFAAMAPAVLAAKHGRIPLKDRPIPVAVSAEVSEAGAPVPQNFLGLSFEVGSLPQLAAYAGEGDLVTMLRSLGPG